MTISETVAGRHVLVALCLAGGCTDPSTTTVREVAVVTAPPIHEVDLPLADDPMLPDDFALTPIEYVEAGVPAHDRMWSGTDMLRAANSLAAIAQDGARRLPRYRGARSGEVFARLTTDENLEFYRNRSVPLEQRMGEGLNYMQAVKQLLVLYLSAINQESIGAGEIVEVLGAQLRMSVVMFGLVDEFFPTLNKTAPDYGVRMDGLKGMKSAMALVVSAGLQTLTESQTYQTEDLKRLAGYLQDTLPDILPELSEGSRRETLVRLRSFVDDSRMQTLQPELTALMKIAERAVEAERER